MNAAIEQAHPERPGVRPIRVVLMVALTGVVVVLLVWQRHRLAGLPVLLMHARWRWIGVGLLAQALSIGALAREQRRLLSARGDLRSLGSVVATTWAGNAISMSLPVVGSAAATVFTYRRFTAIGVDRALAAWSLAISGIYSTVSFAAITAIGGLISGSSPLFVTGLVAVLGGVVPACLVLAGMRQPRIQVAVTRALAATLRLSARVIRRPKGDADVISASTVGQLTSLRLSPGNAMFATGMAVLNWLADLACLACAILAVHGTVPWHLLILAWAVGSTASSLNLTPGGLGVVELALGAALIAIGLPSPIAVGAALLYRATKLGLILAVGGLALLFIHRPDRREQPA